MDWEEKATELLSYLENSLKTAEGFVIEQSPLLVQEFFMWFTAHHIFFIVLSILILFFGYYLHKLGLNENTHKQGRSFYNRSEGGWVIPVAVSFFTGSIVFLVNTYNLIQILVAPRIYLLEKLGTWLSS